MRSIALKAGLPALLFFLACVLVGCGPSGAEDFSIYLVAGGMPATELSNFELEDIELQPEPILSTKDIVSYSAASHEMELTPEAYERIQGLFGLPVEVRGIPFVVTVGDERIYAGGFWTPLSSLSSEGVTIGQPLDPDHTVISISLGYPSPVVFQDQDPRSDPRILNALEAAGKLE